MHLADVVLFAHIATALAAFSLSGVMHASEHLVRKADTVGQMRLVLRPQKLAPLFGAFVLMLLGFGSWLVGLNHHSFSFGDAWVWSAVVALVVLGVDGPVVLDRHTKALEAALAAAAEGPVTPALRELALQPLPAACGWMNTFLALGVVLNMATKPGTATTLLVLVVAALLGAAVGLRARGTSAVAAAVPATA